MSPEAERFGGELKQQCARAALQYIVSGTFPEWVPENVRAELIKAHADGLKQGMEDGNRRLYDSIQRFKAGE